MQGDPQTLVSITLSVDLTLPPTVETAVTVLFGEPGAETLTDVGLLLAETPCRVASTLIV